MSTPALVAFCTRRFRLIVITPLEPVETPPAPSVKAERILLDLILQAAARAQAVDTVADIKEEGMLFAPHFSREISPLLINKIRAIMQKTYRLYWECERLTQTFCIKPFHKALLKPRYTLPLRKVSIREHEVIENAVEVRLVEVCNIPEYALEVSCGRRLIERMRYLLETIYDHIINGARVISESHNLICMLIIVVAIFLAGKIIEIGQKLRR